MAYCGWNQNNFKISIYIHVKKLALALPSYLVVFLRICAGFCVRGSWRLIFLLGGCYFVLQHDRTIKWVFCCIVDGHPCRNFWRNDFIGYMLITYVNYVHHVNYANNIYNNLINKLHLTERCTLKSEIIFDKWKLFKIDRKCLFKSSFHP